MTNRTLRDARFEASKFVGEAIALAILRKTLREVLHIDEAERREAEGAGL